jgi:Protein of unknown function (DUF3379)
MNCIDFRREALAQPSRLTPVAGNHAAGCDSCGPFLERLRELDNQLYAAMCVPVPDGLADRVLVAQGIRGRRRSWLWAVAAGAVLALFVGLLARPLLSGRELAREALAHVAEEPQSFRLVSAHPSDLLATELASQGLRLAKAVGQVTYSTICPMNPVKARHLVVATPEGPVTLLLLAADPVMPWPSTRGGLAVVPRRRAHALAFESALTRS